MWVYPGVWKIHEINYCKDGEEEEDKDNKLLNC